MSGTCKLRFVSRSEDVWYANPRKSGAKRAASLQATRSGKRQQLDKFLGRGDRDPQHNVLVGLRSAGPVQLPNASTWSPDITEAAA